MGPSGKLQCDQQSAKFQKTYSASPNLAEVRFWKSGHSFPPGADGAALLPHALRKADSHFAYELTRLTNFSSFQPTPSAAVLHLSTHTHTHTRTEATLVILTYARVEAGTCSD